MVISLCMISYVYMEAKNDPPQIRNLAMNTVVIIVKAMLTAEMWMWPKAELHRSVAQHVLVNWYIWVLELAGKVVCSVLLHLESSRHPFVFISTRPPEIEMCENTDYKANLVIFVTGKYWILKNVKHNNTALNDEW